MAQLYLYRGMRCWQLLGAGLLWLACGVAQAAPLVAVVLSERSASFVETAEAVQTELAREGVARADVVVRTAAEWAQQDAESVGKLQVVVPLGVAALQQVQARPASSAPIVAALVPRSTIERALRVPVKRGSAALTAVYLDQPLGRRLDLLRLALPQAKRVGVLWGAESIMAQPFLLRAAQARGLELETSSLAQHDNKLFEALLAAIDGADVLLAMPDSQVYSSATIANILLATYRAKVPMLAFSPAYVKAGALMSIHATPSQIGVQVGQIVRQMLQGGAPPAPQYPLEFRITVNDYVARSLGLHLDEASLTQALLRLERKP